MTGIPRNAREIYGNGYGCCGSTTGIELKGLWEYCGMEFIAAGNLLDGEIVQPYCF